MTEIELHDQRTNYDLGHDLYILFNDLPDMDLTSANSLSLRVVFLVFIGRFRYSHLKFVKLS